MSALPRPDLPPGPHRDLVGALHDLHHRAGWPSLRTLASQAGCSHTTVSHVFSSSRLPAWGIVEVLVEAMDGDVAQLHQLWLSASAPTGTPTQSTPPPIAGRRAELAAVRRHVEAGSGLMLVTGEAGMGKTSLVGAAAASVDTVVAVGHCLQLSSEMPLLPVVEALRGLLEVDDGRWTSEAFAASPTFARASLTHLLPELDPDTSGAPPEGPWGLQRLFASITGLLRALAAIRPLALYVDDGHWADRSTLDLLSHLTTTSSPVPLVLTWRSEDPDVSGRHSEWLARTRWAPGVAAVDLGPLSLEETAQQLRLLTPSSTDPALAERIQARSQGLPLYTAQLAAAPDTELPQSLAELLDRRIGDLDGAAWEVLRVLGLAQRRIPAAVLRNASGLGAAEAADGLRVLAQRRLLRRGTGDHAELVHPLFIDAITRRLLPGEAEAVHARLADVLAAEPAAEPAEVADHWRAAGRPDLEVAHRVVAAMRFGERFAHREAVDAWQRVLELWDQGIRPEDLELWEVLVHALDASIEEGNFDVGRVLVRRTEALELPDQHRAALLQRVAVLEIDDGRAEVGLTLLDEALALLEGLSPSPELHELLGERVNFFVQAGRFDEAEADLRRGLDVFGAEEDDAARRRRLAATAWLTMWRGDLELALSMVRDALSLELPGPDPMADIVLTANITDILLCAAAPASQVAEAARGVLRAVDACDLTHTYAGVLVRCNVCWAHLREGDPGAARELLQPVTGREPDLNNALAHQLLGAVELREGDVRSAVQRCRAADAVVRNRNLNWAEGIVWQAEVELWEGALDCAVTLLDEALDVMLPTHAASISGPTLWLLARAHADRLETSHAPQALRQHVLDQLRSRVAAVHRDPFDNHSFEAAAAASSVSWEAELARIRGTGTAGSWTHAAAEWDRITRPHDAAYCRWRAAQVALREGQGTIAARLLKRAATDARQHVPLSQAIAATSRGG